jgi:glycosyltransferase involved in cell wall biosynthesis/aminoglycoside phosphotransferase (APT) family kinase protein
MEEEQTKTAGPAAPAAEPRVRGAIAVLMLRFPHLADTFVLREINELERQGQPVIVVPALYGQQKVVHEEAKPWISRALFTPLLSWAILGSNLSVFFKQPANYLKVLLTLIGGTIVRPSTLLRTLALFPKSVHLSTLLPARGVRHLHAHFATHATTMAYIISSLTGLTYSFTVHGPDVFVHRLLLREKIRKAKFVRTISIFNKAFLSGLYPEETYGKMEVVRTGVKPDVYEEAAEEHANKNERPLILAVADLTPSRGFPYLVDACARLVKAGINVECRIVGEGPLRPLTEQWIAEHGISESVRLLGALPQHEVAQLMGESDIFVFPSIVASDGQMDGIPVSLMEAMAAGKPVIAASISGIPELVRHESSGLLVDAAHPERVAQAITRLVRDPGLRERMGRAGQQKVRQSFDLSRNIAALVQLLDSQDVVDTLSQPASERIAALNWSRLNATAIGVRRVHDRTDAFVAEVTLSDGVAKRDVIVRQPWSDYEDVSPLECARHEFEVISTLTQTLGADEGERTSGGTRYSVPRLLMFDEPNAALVLERADGRSLASIVEAPRRGAGDAVRKAGAWLRLMQNHTRVNEDGRNILTAVVFLALRDLNLAAAANRSLARAHGEIQERIRELEARVSENPVAAVGQHGDYRVDNIFIGISRVDVTSFGAFREGLPLEDIAQFLLDLEVRFASFLGRRRIAKLREAFLDGYGTTYEALDRDALNLFTITKALHMLAHAGYDRRTHATLRKIIRRSMAE